MAKSKGRAARKTQRARVKKAAERGLPTAELAPVPARLRPRLRDASGGIKVAPYSKGTSGEARRKEERAKAAQGGLPMLAKVGIGAAFVLALVFAASQLRKSGSGVGAEIESEGAGEGSPASGEPSTGLVETPATSEGAPVESDSEQGTGERLAENDSSDVTEEPLTEGSVAQGAETKEPTGEAENKMAPAKIAPATTSQKREPASATSIVSPGVASPPLDAPTKQKTPSPTSAASAEKKPTARPAATAPSSLPAKSQEISTSGPAEAGAKEPSLPISPTP